MLIAYNRLDDDTEGSWDIGQQPFVLGRADNCQVVLNDPKAQGVSGQHAQFLLLGEILAVEDLNSTNGTYLNGKRISQRSNISEGDVVSCGKSGPQFQVGKIKTPESLPSNAKPQPKAFGFNNGSAVPSPVQPTPQVANPVVANPINPLGNSTAALSAGGKEERRGTRELLVQVMKRQSVSWRIALAVLVVIGLSLSAIVTLIPQSGIGGKEAYERLMRCSLWILPGNRTMGSGVLVDYKGEVFALTNYHVAEEFKRVSVYYPEYDDGELIKNAIDIRSKGTRIIADVLLSNPRKDIAIMRLKRLPDNCKPLPLASESPLSGDTIYTVGNPGATDLTRWIFGEGEVRSVDESSANFYDKETKVLLQSVRARMIINTLPINGGDSGGPLMNSEFELVGVTTCVTGGVALVSYGIDIAEIRQLLDDVISAN